MSHDFDTSAETYDAVFTYSEIGKAQRLRVHQFLSKNILAGQRLNILELNCGTGEDAVFLSEKNHTVTATDISEPMLVVARKKDPSGRILFVQRDINEITADTFSEKFDLIFSNFGGLNCLSPEQLSSFIENCNALLKPNGHMVLVIMPRNCLWERFYFLLKGDRRKANRRKSKNPIDANVEGIMVPTWYFNPKEVVTLAKQSFQTLAVKPIGICIPPSYLESFFLRKKRLLRFLITIETLFYSRFWAKYADHYLIVLRKK